ncbi:MAG: dihydrodipicolinate synthase family protein [Kiritimatiellae bacterium]|nr:dihydrodipicolinate synthase family protein [Kiritimatiellia bacterium]MDD5521789.1 dihydrodipicolinate synthase family protein [Kiritimatiellia bacterium]
MSKETQMTRRHMLGTMMAGASGIMAGTVLQGCKNPAGLGSRNVIGDPRVQGPFPILSTPFTASGAVDFDVLARQARFVDWCGSPGMIWPQSGDSVDLLTMDEKLQGMEVLAKTSRGFHTALCLGVQGKDTEEMLLFAKHAEKLAPAAIISRPPDAGKTEDDLRQYWRALASVAKRSVIIQTSGGVAYKGPAPSVKLLLELAKESPHFGYIKEESSPIVPRMKELVAAKPTIRRVFSAMGGFGWLYQARLGTEGLITERAVYADLLAAIWERMQSGSDPVGMADAFAKLLLMLNLRETIPGNQLRGYHLYVWKKRGVFKNMLSRNYGPKNSIPASPIVSEQILTREDIDEIESRFTALKPYLKRGSFVG